MLIRLPWYSLLPLVDLCFSMVPAGNGSCRSERGHCTLPFDLRFIGNLGKFVECNACERIGERISIGVVAAIQL